MWESKGVSPLALTETHNHRGFSRISYFVSHNSGPSLMMTTPSIYSWNLKKVLLRRCSCWSRHLKLSCIPKQHTGWVPEIISLWSCYSHAQWSDCLERSELNTLLFDTMCIWNFIIDLKYCPYICFGNFSALCISLLQCILWFAHV